MGEVHNIVIPLHWIPVPAEGGQFDWHKNPPKSVRARDAISGPRVYRWALQTITGETTSVYIGQSERFQKRVSAYRKGKQTSLEPDDTVQSKIKDWENSGGKVELQFLDLDAEPSCINGKPITIASLGDHDTRLMMESIAIFSARASGLKILNSLQDNVHETELRRLLTHLVKEPKKREQILSTILSLPRPKPHGS